MYRYINYLAVLLLALPLISQAKASPNAKQRAIAEARLQVPGRVLAADPVQGDASTYRVKVLRPDGRVKVIRIGNGAGKKSKKHR